MQYTILNSLNLVTLNSLLKADSCDYNFILLILQSL